MPSRPRVLIVAPPLDQIGGQQMQAAGLLAHLAAEGSVSVSFLSTAPSLPGPLPLLQRVRYLRTAVQTLTLAALLLTRLPRHDVVHVFAASGSSFLISATPPVLLARLLGRKIIVNYHSGDAAEHLARRGRTAIPVMRLADAIAVPSDTLARAFAGRGLPARTLPNAVDLSRLRFRARRRLRPVFLSTRTLARRYNPECVLRAFATLQAGTADAALVIAGDGPERASLERLALELGLRNVRFLGWVPPGDMGELYDSADIYLNGSDMDAAPLSILEAWAAGLPVVTTDAGGIPDMVQDGVTGLVVRRSDHEAMAAAARRLLADEELAGALSDAGGRRAVEHGWEAAGARWIALYRDLVRTPAHA